MDGNYRSIYYAYGVPTINSIRIYLMITTICTDLFRIILGVHIAPANLRKKLDDHDCDDKVKIKLRTKLGKEEEKHIYPDTVGSPLTPEDLDLSIMFKILRFVVKIPTHKNDWGSPEKRDRSIAACLDRIRLKRNQYSHRPKAPIGDKEFKNSWRDLQYSVVELEKQFTGGDLFKGAVDNLYALDLSKEQEKMKQRDDKSVGSTYMIKVNNIPLHIYIIVFYFIMIINISHY